MWPRAIHFFANGVEASLGYNLEDFGGRWQDVVLEPSHKLHGLQVFAVHPPEEPVPGQDPERSIQMVG